MRLEALETLTEEAGVQLLVTYEEEVAGLVGRDYDLEDLVRELNDANEFVYDYFDMEHLAQEQGGSLLADFQAVDERYNDVMENSTDYYGNMADLDVVFVLLENEDNEDNEDNF